MSMRYKGGVISATPPTISTTSAPGIWTLQQQFQNAGSWPSAPPLFDPYFEYVSMLLPGNGTNGAQNNTFLDSSTNTFSITRNGNTTQGTFSPYGDNWSNYFDGSGDYLTIASAAALQFGTGNFTVEGWYYANTDNSAGSARTLFSIGRYDDGILMRIYPHSDSLYVANTAYNWGPSSFALRTWNHVVVVRTSTTLSVFVNGSRVFTTTNSSTVSPTTNTNIGAATHALGEPTFDGYISNFRVIKGTGPYDATQTTLTVPTTPLTAITNTSLLTCQSNRFRDASTNNFTITRNGDVSVQRFSPFNPTASYSAATIGGSGYFDGTTDYLRVSSGTVGIANSAFTICLWFYPLSSSVIGLFDSDPNTGNCFRNYNINTIEDQDTPGSVSFAGSYQVNAWNWMCITKSGTSFTVYINGTSVGTGTCSNTMSENEFTVGAINSGGDGAYNGYISDFQVLNTSTVVSPPTAPLTNASGKTLLLSMTNAGIIDNSMMNNLETVGNAQISTAQSKFGGGSLAFDGTGDGLVGRTNPDLSLGNGNFTIECWTYFNAGGDWTIVEKNNEYLLYGDANRWVLKINGSPNVFVIDWTATTGVWYHFACVRNGTTTTMYVNGSAIGSGTSIDQTPGTGILRVGDSPNSNGPLNGYIDDLRITKGIARYTANFSPSPYPFPTL